MKINIHSPFAPGVKKLSTSAKNLKSEKNVKIGNSGLPIEIPDDSFNDKRAAAYLQESWAYNRAKDAVDIMCSKFKQNKSK